MLYEVKLISKEKNVYLFNTEAENEERANEKALKNIIELGWDNYIYKIKSTKRINNGQKS